MGAWTDQTFTMCKDWRQASPASYMPGSAYPAPFDVTTDTLSVR